jgi:hypothetical protein
MNAIKQSLYTLLIGLMFILGVWLFLVQYSNVANDYGLMQERMAQSKWEMKK